MISLGAIKIEKFFWTFLSTLFFGSLFIWIESQKFLRHASWGELILFFIGITILSILFNFIFDVANNLQIQKIRNQPSWTYYAFVGIAIGPVFVTLAIFLISNLVYKIPFDWLVYLGNRQVIFNCFFSLFTTIILFSIKSKKIEPYERFAAGSAGLESDRLDFKLSAKNIAKGFLNINRYISVVGLYGGFGSGKSSYARMIIESLPQEEVLYTYISLTETNEAKDFSKLFAERWVGTLKERYPKMDTLFALPALQSILRETGQGLVVAIFSFFSGINKALIKTRARFFDEFYNIERKYVSENIAQIFGSIPELHENLWVIMIDEIERAQFDEIYRVIEIIERFKNEGRGGMPIKVIFLLCISIPDFKNLVESFKDKNYQAYLINQFFHQDPKSINQPIFVPPASLETRVSYLLTSLKELIPDADVVLPPDIENVYPDSISNPTYHFLEDDEKSLSYAFGLLTSASPRIISRCVQGVAFFYQTFANKIGESQKKIIRLSDLIIMEYIKIKYPFLLLFFERTVDLLLTEYKESGGNRSLTGLSAYFQRQSIKERKLSLTDWITEVTGVEVPKKEENFIEKLVALVAFSYFDFLGTRHHVKSAHIYYNSLAYPKNLYDYLHIVKDVIVTPFDYYNETLIKHEKDVSELKKLSIKDLVGYSRFIGDLTDSAIKLNLEVLNEITCRLLEGRIEVGYRNTGETIYDEAVYRVVFLLMVITEKDKKSDAKPSEELSTAFKLFEKILHSEKVNTGAKYTLLNSLANHTQSGVTGIRSRLDRAFQKFDTYWKESLKKTIQHVFLEADKKYSVDNRIIYENEENFFFTLYQGWSGNIKNSQEIQKIRNIADRSLENYPDALTLYWSKYKFDKDWMSFDDVLRGDHFFGRDENFELYMPLHRLISATMRAEANKNIDNEIKQKNNFWKTIVSDKKYRELVALKNDPSTLRAVLTKRGFLDPILET